MSNLGDNQWILKLWIPNAVECVNLIVKYLKNLGIAADKKYEKKRKILESEVSKKAFQKTDVQSLLDEIEQLEDQMGDEMSYKVVKKMMDLYQKAIEYYSAIESSRYEEFLTKLSKMFANPQVQEALKHPEEEKVEGDEGDEGDETVEGSSKPDSEADSKVDAVTEGSEV